MLVALGSASQSATGFESWTERRDERVIRQRFDFSCGLAALATLLTFEFQDPTSERQLLEELTAVVSGSALPMREGGVSFTDLAGLARTRGYTAQGYYAGIDDLLDLQTPVLVNLRVAGRAHFSLLRGMTESGDVLLADPSWGRRRLAAWEFKRMFYGTTTSRDRVTGESRATSTGRYRAQDGQRGRILLVRTANRQPSFEPPGGRVRMLPTLP